MNVEPPSRAQVIFRYTWIGVGVVAAIVGWTLCSRWEDNRRAAREMQERLRREDARAAEMMGGNRFDILQFYASPRDVNRGESVALCYGVSNARTVKLDPPSATVWPSFARCVSVTPPPGKTTYTLTADDGAGHTKTSFVEVTVH